MKRSCERGGEIFIVVTGMGHILKMAYLNGSIEALVWRFVVASVLR